jgi:UDP-GlcNAc3NAcA epimerase
MIKLVTIVGARPQFVKAAVLSRLIRSEEWKINFTEILVHTGQHYDHNMSEVFFKEMEIPKPDYNLNIGSGTHARMTGEMLIKIEEVCLKEKPDLVLVYGDTNSTIAGALAASKLHIPVAHVEAGLRSYWKEMPEEQNRILTDHISDFLFCPTDTAVVNLKKEGILSGVHQVGDIMFDAYLFYKDKIKDEINTRFHNILESNNIKMSPDEEFFLLTIHRAENTDDEEKLTNIVNALNKINTAAIYPIHPRTRKQLDLFNLKFEPHIKVIDPIGYLDIISLQTKCKFIVTDSGGMQKEAYFSKKPCVTLREQTEWVETVEGGYNILAGNNYENIINSINKVSQIDSFSFLYGNGNSGCKIISLIQDFFKSIKVDKISNPANMRAL